MVRWVPKASIAFIVIEAMAVCTPVAPSPVVGGMIARTLLTVEKADPLGLRRIINEVVSGASHRPHAPKHSEVSVSVRIMTTRACELVRGIRTPGAYDMIRVRGDSPVEGHNVVTGMVSIDWISHAVVDVVFK
jgi:hypothetical protein